MLFFLAKYFRSVVCRFVTKFLLLILCNPPTYLQLKSPSTKALKFPGLWMVCGENESVPSGLHSVRGSHRFYFQHPLSLELTLDPWIPRVGDRFEWQLPWGIKNHHFPAPLRALLLGQVKSILTAYFRKTGYPGRWLSAPAKKLLSIICPASLYEVRVTNWSRFARYFSQVHHRKSQVSGNPSVQDKWGQLVTLH